MYKIVREVFRISRSYILAKYIFGKVIELE